MKLVSSVCAHRSVVNHIAYHESSSLLASTSRDHMIHLWKVSSFSSSLDLICSFDKHLGNVLSLAFSQDGRFLFSGGSDNMVRLWDISNQRFVRNIETIQRQTNHQGDVVFLSTAFEPETLLTMSNDGFLRVFTIQHESQASKDSKLSEEAWMVDLDELMAGQLDDFSKPSTVYDDLQCCLPVCSVQFGSLLLGRARFLRAPMRLRGESSP